MRKKIQSPAIAKIKCPDWGVDRIDGIVFYPITGEVYLINGMLFGIKGVLKENGRLLCYDPELKILKSTYINVESLKQKYRPMNDEKNCPFHFIEKVALINVGALNEFQDGKDNYCCPECKRIWIDVDKEEWTTRVANVTMVKELVEGEQYTNIFKIIPNEL